MEQSGSVRYNSHPPTSGPHFAFPLTPGVYDGAVPDELIVHAPEHGHILVAYAPRTVRPVVDRLRTQALRYPADIVMAPYPGLDAGIALAAWGRLDVLADYDEPRIVRFIDRLRGRYHHGWARPPAC